jgi:hypothetical protein
MEKPSKHPLYATWKQMLARCNDPYCSTYSRYGKRGIRVCRRWVEGEGGLSGFDCFVADVGERPTGMTLDRWPDNNGHYEPDNCRWATNSQQMANRNPFKRRKKEVVHEASPDEERAMAARMWE